MWSCLCVEAGTKCGWTRTHLQSLAHGGDLSLQAAPLGRSLPPLLLHLGHLAHHRSLLLLYAPAVCQQLSIALLHGLDLRPIILSQINP